LLPDEFLKNFPKFGKKEFICGTTFSINRLKPFIADFSLTKLTLIAFSLKDLAISWKKFFCPIVIEQVKVYKNISPKILILVGFFIPKELKLSF